MNSTSSSFRRAGCCLTALVSALSTAALHSQTLVVGYGTKGVSTIAYNSTKLEDTGSNPPDTFHIWHMKSTDLNGNVISSGQYGWGEGNNGESWNPATQTETYLFRWGSISTQFVQNGNNLDMIVTETNNAGSGIIFDGAEIYPFALHFPMDPVAFYGYNQNTITTTGPGVSAADFGTGVVTSVIPNEAPSLYGGWKTDGANTYTPIMTSTAPDGLAPFLPRNDQPLQPGSSLTYTVSLRFTPEGTAANAADAYASFAAKYPSQMTWTDHRILGTAYLASSPNGSNITQPGGYPTNPRRYFNDSSVDITTPSGLQAFQDRILAQAALNVTDTQLMNGQGVITWDIEGEQYPQTTSYVCSPDQIATIAPEMESTITDANSAYFGQKLDDAYFKIMSAAGLRLGLCLRPQVYTPGPNGTASQVYLTSNAAIVANLENKVRYANQRWGATVFYVDSTVDTTGGTLDPAIFQQLITDFPSMLIIPEESTPRYYAYSAPFASFIFNNALGTPASTYLFYPNAFSAILVNDVNPSTLAAYTPQLTAAVAKGDILMGHADYYQANDPTLVAIYQMAGVSTSAPVQSTPNVVWTAPASIPYGSALSAAQLDATANVAGTFTYNPAAGTILAAGSNVLQVTFTPADTKDYKSVTATVPLLVTQAAPALSWNAPAQITFGTALSSTQLNASASVAGTFAYSPAAGAVLPAGTSNLLVTFTPTDTIDYNTVTATTGLTIAQATPGLSWQAPAQIASGTALSGAQLNASANVAGSFSYTPAAGTILSAGTYTLLATFTPTDATDYSSATASVSLTVVSAGKQTPAISWQAPAPITFGTPLSGTQLNASASVPGSFSYNPGPGLVAGAGSQTLQVTFTPTDTTNYSSATATTSLTILKATPVLSWQPPAAITAGSPLSGAQLNATASVPGYFTYNPSAGTVPATGVDTLQTTFTPFDSTDYNTQTASVVIQVNAASAPVSNLAILSPAPGSTVSGVINVAGYVNLTLDSAGTYLMVDGQEVGTQRETSGPYLYPLDTTTLSNGPHTIQLWGHDIGNNSVLSAAQIINVQN